LVGRVVVVVDEQLFDRLPGVGITLDVIAQCETPSSGFMVGEPLAVDEDFGVGAQTPVKPTKSIS